MQPSTRKAAVMLVLAALLGGALGSALTAALLAGRGGHGHDAERYVSLLRRELSLSEPQQDSVRAILGRHRAAIDSLWASLRPRMDSVREEVRAEVTLQLTPAQQPRYRELTARLDRERRARTRSDTTAP
jgi:Spy/CpxP family protein refolding chaperone